MTQSINQTTDSATDPTPIFPKMLDFLAWLTQMSRHFPRLHRATITRRLLDAALDCQERLIEANGVRGQAAKGAAPHPEPATAGPAQPRSNRTRMTRIERIYADFIREDPPHPRHPRSIPTG